MAFPRADGESREFFRSVVPDDPRVEVKAMFGNLGAFVNGNMFLGLLGPDVIVRLPEDERARLLGEDGASVPEPMKGRPMKEYATLPGAWRDTPDTVREWTARSLDWVGAMPPKKPKTKRKS
jgi:TfoX/Sxy family transcriptional regulator of competence genes